MSTTPKKLRVVLVAHHANPTWGSEPLIGWRWAQHLDPLVELTLITHVRNQEAIETAGVLQGMVHFVDTENSAKLWNWVNQRMTKGANMGNPSILKLPAIAKFDKLATAIVRDLVAKGEVDVIMRPSPISPRVPSSLGSLGVPFVIGPVNGSLDLPDGYQAAMPGESKWLARLRPLARLADPFGKTFSQADRILIAARATDRAIPLKHRHKIVRVCENAVMPSPTPNPGRGDDEPLRLLYLGRLIPIKGIQFLLDAIPHIHRQRPVTLDIVGAGGHRTELERHARDLGISERVVFHGAVPVEEVDQRMRDCDIFCLPSVRESGGSVVLEAMNAGRPVIAMDHGGPSETINDSFGRLIAPCPLEGVAERIARAILEIQPAAIRVPMGIAARAEVDLHHTWPRKIEEVLALFRDLVDARKNQQEAA